jgi:RNAse (barnase) inhibitor barstar
MCHSNTVGVAYEIEGDHFQTLEQFYDEVSRVMICGSNWARDLDGFNSILRKNYETPEKGFTICWHNHTMSQERLGYNETVRQLETRLQCCYPSNRKDICKKLSNARARQGSRVFDGEEAEDLVKLILD